jgi:protein-disulfide isomerase
MAFLGEESGWAAAAAECADEHGQFWLYHDVLFTHTTDQRQGVFTLANPKPAHPHPGKQFGVKITRTFTCGNGNRNAEAADC